MAELAAREEVEPRENVKGLDTDDPDKMLLLVFIDELDFAAEVKRVEDEPNENPVEGEEKPNGEDCDAEVTEEPKVANGV